MIPQLILLAILLFDLGVAAAKHGRPKGFHSFPIAIADFLAIVGILFWGGFFDCFNR